MSIFRPRDYASHGSEHEGKNQGAHQINIIVLKTSIKIIIVLNLHQINAQGLFLFSLNGRLHGGRKVGIP